MCLSLSLFKASLLLLPFECNEKDFLRLCILHLHYSLPRHDSLLISSHCNGPRAQIIKRTLIIITEVCFKTCYASKKISICSHFLIIRGSTQDFPHFASKNDKIVTTRIKGDKRSSKLGLEIRISTIICFVNK